MKINEIFKSIQGESTYAGCPCTFVRLSGCNLRCSYCDTTYAYEEGEDLTGEEVLTKVDDLACPLVEVTGGEPLLQKEVSTLIAKLLEKNYSVLLETNGSLDIGHVDPRVIRIMDIKCPDSGMSGRDKDRHLLLQVILRDNCFSPEVIVPAAQDKLDLIVPFQAVG